MTSSYKLSYSRKLWGLSKSLCNRDYVIYILNFVRTWISGKFNKKCTTSTRYFSNTFGKNIPSSGDQGVQWTNLKNAFLTLALCTPWWPGDGIFLSKQFGVMFWLFIYIWCGTYVGVLKENLSHSVLASNMRPFFPFVSWPDITQHWAWTEPGRHFGASCLKRRRVF